MGYAESLLIGISIAAIPGPIFFELSRRSLTGGFWSGALVALGEFLGNFFLLALIFFGVSSFLNIPVVKALLYLVGSAVLIWLGLSALKLKREDLEKSYAAETRKENSLIAGFLIAVSSPIVIAFWISLSGSYLASFPLKSDAIIAIFLIALGFLLFFLPLAFLLHSTKNKISSKYVLLLSKAFGIVLFVYGLSFFYEFYKIALAGFPL